MKQILDIVPSRTTLDRDRHCFFIDRDRIERANVEHNRVVGKGLATHAVAHAGRW